MARRTPQFSDDDPLSVDLDTGFFGVDNRRDPSLLRAGAAYYDVNQEVMGPGLVADSVNMRMMGGQARTRAGCFPPVHHNAPGYELIQGAAVYSDPYDTEWLMLADRDSVWLTADREAPVRLRLPADLPALAGRVEFTQAFQSVVMFRGEAGDPLEWNGDKRKPWRSIVQTAPDPDRAEFLAPLPRAEWGLVMMDRMFFPAGRDEMGWSDLLDYTRTDPVLARARLNQGEDDTIVAAAPYQGNRLVVFKTQSVYYLDGMTPEMDSFRVDRLPGRVGCTARRSVAPVGNDLFWLGPGGVYSLTQTEQSGLRGMVIPVSQPIQGWIDRINWSAAAGACAAFDPVTGLYMLAVPLDGSGTNNVILNYDTAGRQWMGMDVTGAPPEAVTQMETSAAPEPPVMLDPFHGAALSAAGSSSVVRLAVNALLVTDLFGRHCPFLIDGKRVLALGHGEQDERDGARFEIQSRVRTRGYMLGSLGLKRVLAMRPAVATLAATLSADLVTDGVNERQTLLEGQTRDRRRYTRWGSADYDTANPDGTFGSPDREDYTWVAGDAPALVNGIQLGLFQDWHEPLSVRARECRWGALEVSSSTGRFILRTVQADGTTERNKMRPKT